MQYVITDKHDTIKLTNVPNCYFRTAQRFGKIDVHYDTCSIDFYLGNDVVMSGHKSYCAFKQGKTIIVESSETTPRYVVTMCQVIPENHTVSLDVMFCSWLYRQVFEEKILR
ncbi:MAG: hypothetical protein PHR29_05530 [Acholeplasmataceae bacterium]|nr:hypothetical protein [Acholeplasmataceae bacterium]